MGAIADAQEARPRPALQPIDGDGQQLDVVPVPEFAGAVAQKRRKPQDLIAKAVETARAVCVIAALANDEGALPIVATIEHLRGGGRNSAGPRSAADRPG